MIGTVIDILQEFIINAESKKTGSKIATIVRVLCGQPRCLGYGHADNKMRNTWRLTSLATDLAKRIYFYLIGLLEMAEEGHT